MSTHPQASKNVWINIKKRPSHSSGNISGRNGSSSVLYLLVLNAMVNTSIGAPLDGSFLALVIHSHLRLNILRCAWTNSDLSLRSWGALEYPSLSYSPQSFAWPCSRKPVLIGLDSRILWKKPRANSSFVYNAYQQLRWRGSIRLAVRSEKQHLT